MLTKKKVELHAVLAHNHAHNLFTTDIHVLVDGKKPKNRHKKTQNFKIDEEIQAQENKDAKCVVILGAVHPELGFVHVTSI